MGKVWSELRPEIDEHSNWTEHFDLVNRHEPFFNFEIQLRQNNGKVIYLSLSGIPMNDSDGKFRGYQGVGHDITEQRNAEATIENLTLIDQLTGLSNRRHLIDRLNVSRFCSFQSGEFSALIHVDIDRFKTFNESGGHDLADVLLVEVGKRISTCLRGRDTVARVGGDVFVVLATNLGKHSEKAAAGVQRVSQKINAALASPFTPNLDIALTVSPLAPRFSACMGICLFQGTEIAVEDVFLRSESALRKAKQTGLGSVCYFDPTEYALIHQRSQVEKELRIAIELNQLLVYYQPIVGLRGNIVGYEALVRWLHPVDGILSPGSFIDIAEETGLIVPMGEWVLGTVCKQLLAFQRNASTRNLTISVNLSARQLAQDNISDVLAHIVQTSGAPPNQLKLEITESMLLTNIERTIEKMTTLGKLGIRFSLDDFGTGYSSLSYLKKLPLSQLKVDQSFVRGLLTDNVDSAIVGTIIQLATSLGLSVVAEGVELEGQRQALMYMGCKEFQGYLFGKPGPMES